MGSFSKAAVCTTFAVGVAVAPLTAAAAGTPHTAGAKCSRFEVLHGHKLSDAYSGTCVKGYTFNKHHGTVPVLPQINGSPLPFTGADIAAMVSVAAISLGGGTALLVAGRRRRRPPAYS